MKNNSNNIKIFRNKSGDHYCKLPVKMDVIIKVNPDDIENVNETYIMREVENLNTYDLGEMLIDTIKQENYHPVYIENYY